MRIGTQTRTLPMPSYMQSTSMVAMEAKRVTKGAGSDGLYKLRGPAIFLNKVSKNNRDYIPESVHTCVDRLYPYVDKKSLFGELEHPATDDVERIARIDYENLAHRIDKIWFDEATNAYWIEITILDNPQGQRVAANLNIGSPVYVSLRSLLDPRKTYVDKNGVTKAFMVALITIDIVLNPGYEDAEMEIVFRSANESKKFITALESEGIILSEIMGETENPVLVKEPYEISDGEPMTLLTLNTLRSKVGSKCNLSALQNELTKAGLTYEIDKLNNTLTVSDSNETVKFQAIYTNNGQIIQIFDEIKEGNVPATENTNKTNMRRNTSTNAGRKYRTSSIKPYRIANESETEILDNGMQVTTSNTATDLVPSEHSFADVNEAMNYIISNLLPTVSDSERETIATKVGKLNVEIDGDLNDKERAILAKTILDVVTRFNDVEMAKYYKKITELTGDIVASESRRNKRINRRHMYKIANESEIDVQDDGTQVVTSTVATDFIPEPMTNADIVKTIDYIIGNLLPETTDGERKTIAACLSEIAIDLDASNHTPQQRAIIAKTIMDEVTRFNDQTLANYYNCISDMAKGVSVAVESRATALNNILSMKSGIDWRSGKKSVIVAKESKMYKIADKQMYKIATEDDDNKDVSGAVPEGAGQTVKNTVDTKFKFDERLTDENLGRTFDYAIMNTLPNSSDAEQAVVATHIAEYNISDSGSMTLAEKARMFVEIMKHIPNAYSVELQPYFELGMILAEGKEITEFDREKYSLLFGPPTDSVTAIESTASLLARYKSISAMKSSEFEGIYAIEHIPNAYTSLFKGLSNAGKRLVAERASKVSTAAENVKFWATLNFIEVEKSVIATENAIVTGKSDSVIAMENANKIKTQFIGGTMLRYTKK